MSSCLRGEDLLNLPVINEKLRIFHSAANATTGSSPAALRAGK